MIMKGELKTTFAGALEDYRQAAINAFYMPESENDMERTKARVAKIYQECPENLKPGSLLIIEVIMGRNEPLCDDSDEKAVARLDSWLKQLGEYLINELAPPSFQERKKVITETVASVLKLIVPAQNGG